jgi:hypothetical protein
MGLLNKLHRLTLANIFMSVWGSILNTSSALHLTIGQSKAIVFVPGRLFDFILMFRVRHGGYPRAEQLKGASLG